MMEGQVYQKKCLTGHKAEITALAMYNEQFTLISGSKDG